MMSNPRPHRPVLGAIRAVTYGVPDLEAIERAYVEELGYTLAHRGRVGAGEARAWDAPAAEDAHVLILAPASGEPVFLRFVEDARAAGWTALTTFGWNATEFVVQDVDALARRLDGGAFEIIGPPKSLTRFPMIRAMQAIGPAGECCYFTQVGEGSGLDLAAARSFVGRVFIVVGAGPDADALFAPYGAFANRVDPPVATPVTVISRAHGLPPDTLHRHGLVRLEEGHSDRARPVPRIGRTAPGRLRAAASRNGHGDVRRRCARPASLHRGTLPTADGPALGGLRHACVAPSASSSSLPRRGARAGP